MKPIIEVYEDVKRYGRSHGRPRPILICRSPEHGAILRRRQIPSTASETDIVALTLQFTAEMLAWFCPQRDLVSKCEDVLL